MRIFILAVTGLALAVAACSSYGTSTLEVQNGQQAQVASVVIALPSASLVAGATQRADVTLKDASGARLTGRAIVWSTSAAAVASINDSGVIVGVAPGAATLSAVSEGVAGQAGLTVVPRPPLPVATVVVAINPAAVVVGQTARATAVLRDSAGNGLTDRAVTWQSGSPSVATVSSSGDVSAVAPGTATISAASEGKTASASLNVSAPAPVPVASVSVTPASLTLLTGATAQLAATTRDANNSVLSGRFISWSSSNTSIATVSGSGLVTAVAPGSVSITASSEGQTAAATVSVSASAPAPVASVSVSPASSTLQAGGTLQLAATTRDASNNVLAGRIVTWSSSNIALSSVSASGLVTAIAAGSATITATSETKTGTAIVTVTTPPPAPVASVSVSPPAPSASVGDSVTFSATTRDANNNVLTGRAISWISSNTAVATISAAGVAKVLASGSATITATSETKSGSATITVTDTTSPPPPPPGSSNEPSGMTLIDERPFNSLDEHPAWDTDNTLSIVSDPTAPKSPANVLRATFPAGFAGGSSGGHTGVALPGRRVLYITYWAKYSTNWQGHLTGVNKHGYAWANGNPIFVMETDAVGNGPMKPHMAIQDSPGSDRWYDPNLVTNASVTRGSWFHMEYVVVGNTAGMANGTMDYWLNGVHIASYSGIQWTSSTTAWDVFEIRPIWGGVGDVVNATQTLDFDHVYLSGKN